jgi:hypothetical protein
VDDAENMPFYILFGVIVAAMLAGIFIMQYNRQLEARVDEQAQALANDLARISFTAFSREQPSFLLPRNLGGSDYKLSIYENKFIVHIKAGKQSGMNYYSTANVSLSIDDNYHNFVPGGSIYFRRSGDVVIVSSSQENLPPENLPLPATATPPAFYNFAKVKENAKAATAIAAAYFFALENFALENKSTKDNNNNPLDVWGYENGENVSVQLWYKGGKNIFGVKVSFRYENYENTENIWKVGNAWIENGLTIKENLIGTIVNLSVENISIENAYASGWLYSPTEVLAYLRSRTWENENGDRLVVPADAQVRAAAATTNVSTYPTYCVTFDGYVLYYRAMPWYWDEDQPGFVFQSKPPLEAVA